MSIKAEEGGAGGFPYTLKNAENSFSEKCNPGQKREREKEKLIPSSTREFSSPFPSAVILYRRESE